MSTESRVDLLATAMGADVKTLLESIGVLADLSTAAKTSLVVSINEVAAAASAASGIDDAATATTTTWSSTKINSELTTALAGLVGTAGTTLDTIQELATAFENNPDVLANIRQLVTDNATAIATLATNVGDTNADFVAAYTAAKNA